MFDLHWVELYHFILGLKLHNLMGTHSYWVLKQSLHVKTIKTSKKESKILSLFHPAQSSEPIISLTQFFHTGI